jgi:hypothetical protein
LCLCQVPSKGFLPYSFHCSTCHQIAITLQQVTWQEIARTANFPEHDIAQLNLPIQKLALETTGREYKLVAHIFAVEQHDSNMVKLPLLEL